VAYKRNGDLAFKILVLGVEIKLNDKCLTIINIYGPNKDDITTFKLLEQALLEHDEKHI